MGCKYKHIKGECKKCFKYYGGCVETARNLREAILDTYEETNLPMGERLVMIEEDLNEYSEVD